MTDFKSVVLLLTLGLIILWGCEQSVDMLPQGDDSPNAVRTAADTSAAQQKKTPAVDVTELQQEKTQIESRLEELLALIEQKENALLTREQSLLAREQRLIADFTVLNQREASVRRLQIISWVVLFAGLAAIAIGLVISRRTPKKDMAKDDSKTDETSKAPKKDSQKTKGGRQEDGDSKDAYLELMHAQLKEWESKIDGLKSKSSEAKDDAKTDYKKQVDALSRKLRSTRKKIKELAEAKEGEWQGLKQGVEKASEDLKKAVDSASDKLK